MIVCRIQVVINYTNYISKNDRAAESVEQDQTARLCRLTMEYTLRKIYCIHRSEQQDTD